MSVRFPLAVTALLLLISGPMQAQAQQPGYASPSLLPLPQVPTQFAAQPNYPNSNYASLTAATTPRQAYYTPGQNSNGVTPLPPPGPQENVPSGQGAGNLWNDYGNGAEHSPDYENALEDSGWGCCGSLCTPRGCCGCGWYAGVYGLYMTRDDSNVEWLAVDDLATGGTGRGVFDTSNASMDWQPGTEIEFGKFFCDGRWGIGASYWGLYSDRQEANIYASNYTGDLVSPLTFSNLTLSGTNVAAWYDTSLRDRLRRDYEFHNVELNVFWRPCGGCGTCGVSGGCGSCGQSDSCGSCCRSPFTFTALAGVRFFRMDEGFQFSSDDQNTTFDDGVIPGGELHYNVDTENNLIGLQLGCRGDYCIGCRWSFFGDVKFGVFGNHMTSSQDLRDGLGVLASVNNGPDNGEWYDLNSSASDVAFLGELRLGVGFQICRCWRATLGWRAMALSGVALTTNQIPHNFGDLNDARTIHRNGSLILHGMQAGLEANF